MIRIEGPAFALLLAFIITAILGYIPLFFLPESYIEVGGETTTLGLICSIVITLNVLIVVISLVAGLIFISKEDIGITIKLPHFYIKEYFRKKKELTEKKERLYNALFNANTTEEIDLINRKLESLK